jgi:1-deoxy-D-xylulose-5-phosphate reductoisomerase
MGWRARRCARRRRGRGQRGRRHGRGLGDVGHRRRGGLAPTLAAARTGAVIALGQQGKPRLRRSGSAGHRQGVGRLGDSRRFEHSAIFQVLQPDCAHRVARLILTASGGPFRAWDKAAMRAATPEQAIAHPNWSIGAKISVDSATMMNKGLEMIEASYLFATPEDRVDVVIHPQSVIHSLVEYADGSTLAQLGPPDMRAPIAAPSPGRIACRGRLRAWTWPPMAN